MTLPLDWLPAPLRKPLAAVAVGAGLTVATIAWVDQRIEAAVGPVKFEQAEMRALLVRMDRSLALIVCRMDPEHCRE